MMRPRFMSSKNTRTERGTRSGANAYAREETLKVAMEIKQGKLAPFNLAGSAWDCGHS